MDDKEKSKNKIKLSETETPHYDWRGNVAVYSERYGWHLKPTVDRDKKMKTSVSKDKKLLDI
tara:strand:- start:200 stop:385 length:186 start_codon:yes stop_codon:yes gene_type:complete